MILNILKSSDVKKPARPGTSIMYIDEASQKLCLKNYDGQILNFETDNSSSSNTGDAGNTGNTDNMGDTSSSNGPFNVLCVTYYRKGFDKISSFEMSGFPTANSDLNIWEDLTPLNGTYTITNETKDNDEFERVYKHTNGSDTYYFHYIKENEESGGSYGWAVSKNRIATDAWSATCLTWQMVHITEGSENWYNEMDMWSCQITISNMQKTYIDNEIKCKAATGYDEETLSYTFAEEITTLSQYEVEPIEHYCYVSDGTKLIGNSVGNEGGQHLLSYVKGNETDIIETIHSPRNYHQKYQFVKAWKYPSFQVPLNYSTPRISSGIVEGKSCFGTSSDCPELTIYDDAVNNYATGGRMELLPYDLDKEFTVSMFFDGCGQNSNYKRRLFYIYFNGTYNIKVELDSTSFNVLLGESNEKIITTSSTGYKTGWHHIALTNNAEDKKIILYLDGVKKGEYNYEFMIKNNFSECDFRIGRDDGSFRLGYYREIKLFNIALTPSQVTTDYNKGLNAL